VYPLLFRASAATLLEVAADHYEGFSRLMEPRNLYP
jgi:hypothetical protein